MPDTRDVWWNPTRPAGFRLSGADGAVIALVLVATWLGWSTVGSLALGPSVVLGHFFLFCNVFRVGRRLEYAWAAIFVVNVLCWTNAGMFGWTRVLVTQAPVTLAVVGVTVWRSEYHGVGSGWLAARRSRAADGGS